MKRLTITILVLLIIVSCGRTPRKIEYSGITQGSYFAITYYDEAGRTFEAEIDSIFKEVDNSVSLWNENSIIRKVNRNEDVVVNQIFKDNFEWARKASEFSDGAFDATIGPLVSAWGFHYKKELEMTPQMVDSIRQLVDYRKIQIIDNKVVKANPNMTLDFNAVAQGYTADIKPHGQMWTIGIEKPAENFDSEQSVQMKLQLKDKGIVTSGNYRKYIEKDGVRYSHSIDPKTGYPVEQNLLSVTIIADNASWADCLATVCMIVGKEKASQLLASQDGLEAYFIFVEDGKILTESFPR